MQLGRPRDHISSKKEAGGGGGGGGGCGQHAAIAMCCAIISKHFPFLLLRLRFGYKQILQEDGKFVSCIPLEALRCTRAVIARRVVTAWTALKFAWRYRASYEKSSA